MTPGKKSTEFGLMIALIVLMVANGTEYVNIPWETVQWFIGSVALYGGGRQFVKVKAKAENNGTEKNKIEKIKELL